MIKSIRFLDLLKESLFISVLMHKTKLLIAMWEQSAISAKVGHLIVATNI